VHGAVLRQKISSMPLDLDYESSASDASRPGSPQKPVGRSLLDQSITAVAIERSEQGNRQRPPSPTNGHVDDKTSTTPPLTIKGVSHIHRENGSSSQIANTTSPLFVKGVSSTEKGIGPIRQATDAAPSLSIKGASLPRDANRSPGETENLQATPTKQHGIDLTIEDEKISPHDSNGNANGTSGSHFISKAEKESSNRTVRSRLPGSSPSEEGALVMTPRPASTGRRDQVTSPQLSRNGSVHDNVSRSAKRDRRRSKGDLAESSGESDGGHSRSHTERKRRRSERYSDDEFDGHVRHKNGSKDYMKSPSRGIPRPAEQAKGGDSDHNRTRNTSDRPEQRTSRRLPEDDRDRDHHRSSRIRRNDDGLDYENAGDSQGSEPRDRYRGDSRRERPDYDDYRNGRRDRYDDRRSDRDSRYRHDRYRPDERSYRRDDYDDDPYRSGGRRDYDDDWDVPYRGGGHSHRGKQRERYDDRERDLEDGRARGRYHEDHRGARSPLLRPAGEARPRSPIAWTHAPQRNSGRTVTIEQPDLEPPAPPPELPDVPPPPPSPPKKRKTPPPDIASDEQNRATKRPKLTRQEPSTLDAPSPPRTSGALRGAPLPPLPASGAVTPNPELMAIKSEPRIPTPIPVQAVRTQDRDEEFRQERKHRRDLFPDRSRIGLGQGKRLDFERETKAYGKAFAGLGRLEGYKVVKSNDGALGRGTFGYVIEVIASCQFPAHSFRR
jgi:hypothetical protein